MEGFDKRDWAAMHDCLLRVKGTSTPQEEMETLFLGLPESMKGDAREWGMWDTLWREQFIEWLKENKNTAETHSNGLICPSCTVGLLIDSDPQYTLMSLPPKKNVHCSQCDYKGFRTI